jgi:hypothetical protein
MQIINKMNVQIINKMNVQIINKMNVQIINKMNMQIITKMTPKINTAPIFGVFTRVVSCKHSGNLRTQRRFFDTDVSSFQTNDIKRGSFEKKTPYIKGVPLGESSIVKLIEFKGNQESLTYRKSFKLAFTATEVLPTKKTLAMFHYLQDLLLNIEEHNAADFDEKRMKDYESLKGQFRVLNHMLNGEGCFIQKVEPERFCRFMDYGYNNEESIGRLYSLYPSIPLLQKQIRYPLFKDIYKDIDLVNAHPSIMLDFALKNYVKCDILKNLVDHREEFLLNEVSTDYDEAKKLILVMLNMEESAFHHRSKVIQELFNEIVVIRGEIFKQYYTVDDSAIRTYLFSKKDFFKESSVPALKVSVQSHYCMTVESDLVLNLKDSLIQELAPSTHDFSFVPFFDGAYVRCSDLSKHRTIEEFVSMFNKTILPYPFSFKIKDITPSWDSLNEEVFGRYVTLTTALNKKKNSDFMHNLVSSGKISHFAVSKSTADLMQSITNSKKLISDKKKSKSTGSPKRKPSKEFVLTPQLTEQLKKEFLLYIKAVRELLLNEAGSPEELDIFLTKLRNTHKKPTS